MASERVIVDSKAALIAELNKKTDEIVVNGGVTEKIAEIKQGQLNDSEKLGYLVGAESDVFEYAVSRLLDMFDPASKEDKKMYQQVTRLYTIQQLTKESFLLRLKQLDY
ncbi:hypothetical protein GIX45_17215 [Erwinia sp. CPCC 100877]|nr:hypothetical protein [Erwinia sp. CPCC 100877]